MSQMNPGGMGPGLGSQMHSGRPGQMTAVMRAIQATSGPKVLRIGLVAAGRILEERIVKQRTNVTVGPSEKSTFVVQANLPAQFKLFELVGNDYYLNFLDGMTGRIALATGITDLAALKGQAKRVGPAGRLSSARRRFSFSSWLRPRCSHGLSFPFQSKAESRARSTGA